LSNSPGLSRHPNGNGFNLQLKANTKPTLDDEEIFDGSNSFRSQYRFETTEDDLVNQTEEGDIYYQNHFEQDQH
jgi:hypothetical protein